MCLRALGRLDVLLLAAALVCSAEAASAQTRSCQSPIDDLSSIRAQTAPDASVLCVTLYVKDGRLMARGAPESRLYPSSVIDQGKPLDEKKRARIEAMLLDDLTTALNTAKPIFYYGLTDQERADYDAEQLLATAAQPVDHLGTDTWSDQYVEAFSEWATAGDGRLDLGESVGKLIGKLDLEKSTALNFMRSSNPLDAELGFLALQVIDLTPSFKDGDIVCFMTAGGECRKGGVVADRGRIARVLSEFEGWPWRAPAMKQRVDRYYLDRGLTPVVEISDAAMTRFIHITESDFISRVIWSKDLGNQAARVDEFISVLISRRDFREYLQHPDLVTDIKAFQDGAYRGLNYSTGLPADSGEAASPRALGSPAPLSNGLKLQAQQAALDALEMILTLKSAPGQKLLSMIVEAKSPSGTTERPTSAPAAAVPQPLQQGIATPAAPLPQAAPLPTPDVEDAPAPMPPRDQPRFIGGGVLYRPGQSVKPFLQFQQSKLNLRSALASISGQFGGNGETFGSGSGRVDYLWFGTLHHRLSIDGSGGTDFTQHRLVGGRVADERRTGGFTRVEYEALGGNNDSHLTFAGEGRRTAISLSPVGPDPDLTLETLTFSAVYGFQNIVGAHPFRLQVEPSIRIGRGVAGTNGEFTLGGVVANLNQNLSDQLVRTLDVTLRLNAATVTTPLLDRPVLGGAETLRGFRPDDVIGTSVWSVQPEVWFAFSRLFGRSAVADFVEKQHLQLAAFVDVGGATGVSPPAGNGVRWGPGLGLRIPQGPIALKVDWAHGIGDGASGPGRGRFYVGVTTAQTF